MTKIDTIINFAVGWFPMLLIAISNGLLRELTYGKIISKYRANQISSMTAIIFFWIYTLSFFSFSSFQQYNALLGGFVWLIMTIAFELSLGRFILKKTWDELLDAYNLMKGNLWPIVLLSVYIFPYTVTLLKKIK